MFFSFSVFVAQIIKAQVSDPNLKCSLPHLPPKRSVMLCCCAWLLFVCVQIDALARCGVRGETQKRTARSAVVVRCYVLMVFVCCAEYLREILKLPQLLHSAIIMAFLEVHSLSLLFLHFPCFVLTCLPVLTLPLPVSVSHPLSRSVVFQVPDSVRPMIAGAAPAGATKSLYSGLDMKVCVNVWRTAYVKLWVCLFGGVL